MIKRKTLKQPVYFKARTILAGLIYESLSDQKKDLADKVLQLLVEYEPVDERKLK